MKRILLSGIFATTLALGTKAQTGLFVPELASFDTAMRNLMDTYNVPGGQLAITYQGRLVYNRGFGLADVASGDSVNPNSTFRIASVSKPVTAVACMKLFEQGLLQLDAKVFGPNGILNDTIYQNILDPRVNDITVRMLLQHRGGWNSATAGDPMFDAFQIATNLGVSSPPSASEVIQYVLANKSLNFTPGTLVRYSNFGFCVLGRVIEKITGQTYENYVTNTILNPLGMSGTKLGFNLAANRLPNEVHYYDYPGAPQTNSVYDNTTPVPWPYGGFNLEYMDAHGGWVSSCEDLLKLVCAFDKFNTRPDILAPSTVDTMTKGSPINNSVASGIYVNNSNWYHTGSLPGTTSEIVRNGSRQLNWAILLNTRDQQMNINAAVDDLVWDVLPSITSWPSHDLFTNPVSVNNPKITENSISVYPNPTKGLLHFSGIANVRLINALGQVIITKEAVRMIDLTAMSKGIYFVILTDDNGLVMQRIKVIKE